MIAVLLATYNGEKYVAELLDSILAQTYDDFVIYIHDDGSTDRTANILEGYVNTCPNKICILKGAPTGTARDNFFYLMESVETDYYMFADQDDYWCPNKIAKSVDEIKSVERNNIKKPCLVFSDAEVINKDGKIIDKSLMHYNQLAPYDLSFNRLVVQNTAPGCTMLFNKAARDLALCYKRCNIDNIMIHDWWIILTTSALGKVEYMDMPLMKYRQHGSNAIGAKKETGLFKNIQLIWWALTLSHIGRTKERIRHFVNQGKELKVLELQGDNEKIVKGLSKFYSMSKIERIRFVRRFKLYRNKRNIWQMICL